MLCLQSEKEEKEVEKDVEENKQKEEKETKWSCQPPAVVVLYTFEFILVQNNEEEKLQTHFI